MEEALSEENAIKEIYGKTGALLSPEQIDDTIREEDGFIIPITYSEFDTKSAVSKVAELRDVCMENGADFVYVAYPSKLMLSDEEYEKAYNIKCNNGALRSSFLSGLSGEGVNVLDMGKELTDAGYTYKDIFYKTDHHWTTRCGFFAAGKMATYVNEEFGVATKLENLEEDKFSFEDYQNLWLGEMGREYSQSWADVLDDYAVIKPTYETHLEYTRPGIETKEGDFSVLLDEELVKGKIDLYETSLHYAFFPGASPFELANIRNIDYPDGPRVLLIKDSFSVCVTPFLSLACGQLDTWDLRGTPGSLYEGIQNGNYDVVILAYTDY